MKIKFWFFLQNATNQINKFRKNKKGTGTRNPLNTDVRTPDTNEYPYMYKSQAEQPRNWVPLPNTQSQNPPTAISFLHFSSFSSSVFFLLWTLVIALDKILKPTTYCTALGSFLVGMNTGTTLLHLGAPDQRPCNPRPESAHSGIASRSCCPDLPRSDAGWLQCTTHLQWS